MNKKLPLSLAMLIIPGIYGVALPAWAQDSTAIVDGKATEGDDTIVVTAAQQNLQAPGVSTITADEIRKNRRRAMCLKSSVPCQALT
ncbi:TonB-dependent receptor; Outer membrane receptor for ferric enterobactin and colicins B, D [Cronobacter condimenti 1330]|uniref:TonB-dependent receptor Outer membrane receptor for ferric enterobactin and colicins B, D n=1 Tax=Cronobacter condimenti 1330 TaxID=1073999 RepID=K8AKU5_9ENTR|nr:TonB-dependent receptor; Outer membrane receptor for ferric enterobactin and colicins B, D [Cronobacter condimenti 1330]